MTTAEKLRARIIATANPKPAKVETDSWGTVWVRILTVADVDTAKTDPEDKMRIARSACRVLCDADGILLFDPESDTDVKLVATLPWAELRAVLAKAEQAITGSDEGNV